MSDNDGTTYSMDDVNDGTTYTMDDVLAELNQQIGLARQQAVMAELKMRVPENEGLWTPVQAATHYGELDQFKVETGWGELEEQAMTASREANDSPDAMEAFLKARAAYQTAGVDVETGRNRYQQSTEFTPL